AYIANLALLTGFIALGLDKVLAQAIAVVLVVPLNFLGNKLWSFRLYADCAGPRPGRGARRPCAGGKRPRCRQPAQAARLPRAALAAPEGRRGEADLTPERQGGRPAVA